MTSLAISFGALPIAMSLGAASTSRIGMGEGNGGTIFSLVYTFVIPTLFYVVKRKHYPEFEHIEEYEKMLSKMKIIKQLKFYFFIFHCWFSNSGSRSLDN
jgi:HAE1 family hydrophobic/amphiphilic exporter-1/multidrug efflux pump